jgi:hypothetical protein
MPLGKLRKALEPARHAQFTVDHQSGAPRPARRNSTVIPAASIIAAMV